MLSLELIAHEIDSGPDFRKRDVVDLANGAQDMQLGQVAEGQQQSVLIGGTNNRRGASASVRGLIAAPADPGADRVCRQAKMMGGLWQRIERDVRRLSASVDVNMRARRHHLFAPPSRNAYPHGEN